MSVQGACKQHASALRAGSSTLTADIPAVPGRSAATPGWLAAPPARPSSTPTFKRRLLHGQKNGVWPHVATIWDSGLETRPCPKQVTLASMAGLDVAATASATCVCRAQTRPPRRRPRWRAFAGLTGDTLAAACRGADSVWADSANDQRAMTGAMRAMSAVRAMTGAMRAAMSARLPGCRQ